jgi:hypothetical protein
MNETPPKILSEWKATETFVLNEFLIEYCFRLTIIIYTIKRHILPSPNSDINNMHKTEVLNE